VRKPIRKSDYIMPKTIIEYLHHHVSIKPNDVAFSFLPSKTEPLTELTFKEFWSEASSVANFLKSKVKVGDKVLLLYPPNIDYVVTFYGCLLAGVIAVPAPLPKNNSTQVINIVNECEPVLVLTTLREVSEIKTFWQKNKESINRLSIFTSDNSVSHAGELEVFDELDPKAPAFVHYFSDSKNMNKGMTLTHADIIENVKHLPLMSGETTDDIFVGWLPFFNDMDLIALCS
jgi:acyl-CoA synthetase (AMP-forming)/AMP-acid ligase II